MNSKSDSRIRRAAKTRLGYLNRINLGYQSLSLLKICMHKFLILLVQLFWLQLQQMRRQIKCPLII